MHNRQNALGKWLERLLTPASFTLQPLAGDASFRRYFRLYYNDTTQIVMDSPPDKETIEPFITIANLLETIGVRTPKIHTLDKNQGFILLDDFGDTLLFNELNPETADKLYTTAMQTLINIQSCPASIAEKLPSFDKPFILSELNLFIEWFLHAYLKLKLTPQENKLLAETFDWLSHEISLQPRVFIHRDYHSRNIMLLPSKNELGVIDFQDAMYGPFTYDLVSLLKDCYIQWPPERVNTWLADFHQQAPVAKHYNLSDFIRAFDFCGLQRHLKVLGIFSRLHLRDNKPNYLRDLPLTLHYVMTCLANYEELNPFYQFMQNRIYLP
ncbi:aminoglycoside phosphotransferase family protein [Legionella fairfieldensis]|uniref:aminoglycoside phosphotransferase family protein n=1 Tax=Legionella fairfieldensis TaxID=45064 RepID=UPI00048B6BD7|nr:phosphotransferase [Legionella fairfieldensis]